MTSLMNIDTTSASLAALRAALKGAEAYNGVARFNREAMADYARKVQVLRADGETVAITRDNVDALMEAPEPQPEPAPVAEVEVVAEPTTDVVDLMALVEQAVATKTARPAGKLSHRFVGQFNALLALATEQEDGSYVATTEQVLEAGWSKAYSTRRTGWCKSLQGGRVAAALGYKTSTRKDGDSFVVVITAA